MSQNYHFTLDWLEEPSMSRRRLTLLVVGGVLIALGVGLILYGNTLPPDFVVHGIWNYSIQDKANSLMLIGVFPACIGISLLIFWFFTRSKPASC
jgi:hypothetical protein